MLNDRERDLYYQRAASAKIGISAGQKDHNLECIVRLAADLAAAHQAHDAFLKQSMDNALEHIPRLLRGTVKKILGL